MTQEPPQAGFALREPATSDYARLATWLPDESAALYWAGPELGIMTWPLDGPRLALALYRDASEPRSLLDGRGKLVGFGEYYFRPGKRLRLARLIVAPERRGQRLINTLIGRLIRDALHQQSCTTVELAVFIDNRPAVHAYRRLGFQPIAERSAATALTMQRTIAS